jgi:hypothetical protein
MSTQPEPQSFEAPVLLVEARYRSRTLCAHVLSARSRRGFTVGGAPRADAPVDPRFLPAGLPANDNHTLVAPSGGGFVVNLSPAMRERAERSATGLRVPCGEVVFDITAAASPPPLPRRWWGRGAGDDARVVGGVALAMLLLLALVRAVPDDPHALSLEDIGKDLRFDLTRVVPHAIIEPPAFGRAGGAGGGAPPVAASGPAGAAGKPNGPRVDARRATKGPATNQDARDVEAYVRRTSLLSILDGHRSEAVEAIFARTRALGSVEDSVLGQMVGTTLAEAWGLDGLRPSGSGTGDADTGRPTIGGDGRLHTIGLRPGPGEDRLDDHGGGPLGPRRAIVPEFKTQAVVVRGALDKEIVRRVVRQHLNEVRYCYEQALARTPTLAGRVVAQFTIAASGRVLAAALQSSTLGASGVESCIVDATKRWLYPAPEGGGLVTVSYPF